MNRMTSFIDEIVRKILKEVSLRNKMDAERFFGIMENQG